MHDGFDITFRGVIPEAGILELVLAQLAEMHGPAGLHCSVVLFGGGASHTQCNAHVELRPLAHGRGLHGDALGRDPYDALRLAFLELRNGLTLH